MDRIWLTEFCVAEGRKPETKLFAQLLTMNCRSAAEFLPLLGCIQTAKEAEADTAFVESVEYENATKVVVVACHIVRVAYLRLKLKFASKLQTRRKKAEQTEENFLNCK